MMLHLKNDKGFTLVELLVGIVIITLIMGGISTLLASSVRVHSASTAKASNIKDASTIVNNIIEELQYARASQITFLMPSVGEPDLQVTKKQGTANTATSFLLDATHLTFTVPGAITTPTNHGVHFVRDIIQPASFIAPGATSGGDGVITELQSRRIRLINNTVVMDYGPIHFVQVTPWTIVRSIDLSTGNDLVATTPLSGIPKFRGSIQSLTITADYLPDNNIASNDFIRRKRFTVTVVANANGLNSGPKDNILNTNADDTKIRSATFTTSVVNNNTQ